MEDKSSAVSDWVANAKRVNLNESGSTCALIHLDGSVLLFSLDSGSVLLSDVEFAKVVNATYKDEPADDKAMENAVAAAGLGGFLTCTEGNAEDMNSPVLVHAGMRETHERIDKIEDILRGIGEITLPVEHVFTPGLVSRKIVVPAGKLVTTKIHKFEHQYVMVSGEASIWLDGVGVRRVKGPFYGVTKPFTRRVIFAHTDVEWITFHPANSDNEKDFEAEVIMTREQLSAEIDNMNLLMEATK
jgi:hypothetical protein